MADDHEESQLEPNEDEEEEVSAKPLSEEEILEILLSSSTIKLQNLVPSNIIKSESATKVAMWILLHSNKKSVTSRLKWLTGIIQYGVIESVSNLHKLFTPFIQLIYNKDYHAIVCHLLYLIATPNLHKWQVERICRNEAIIGLTKPLAGLIGRLKSLRPDLVPHSVPHISTVAAFPRLPVHFRNGLMKFAEQNTKHNNTSFVTGHDNTTERKVTKKMKLDILPRIDHTLLKSSFEIDFEKLILLSQFDNFDALLPKITSVQLPNHLGSLLNRREYHHVLTLNYTHENHVILSQWIYLTLCYEFIERYQDTGKEGRELLLERIAEFQEITGRRLKVVYDFLAEYLQKWDGIQHQNQIWKLLEQIPFFSYSDLYDHFLVVLEQHFQNSSMQVRTKILRLMSGMIKNLLLQRFGPPSKARHIFEKSTGDTDKEDVSVVEGIYVVNEVIRFTERLCNTALTSSTDVTLVYVTINFYLSLLNIEMAYQLPFRTFCQPMVIYSALFSCVPSLISMLCQLLCKYNVMGKDPLITKSFRIELEEFRQDSLENAAMLNCYINDTSNCLFLKQAFKPGSVSLIGNIQKNILKLLSTLGPYKSASDLTNHPAFMGLALEWMRSDPKVSSQSVYDAIHSNPDTYLRFLFSSIPAIAEYIRRFNPV